MKTYIYIILLTISQLTFATGLQPINTDVSVQVQAVDFDLEVRGLYVSGLMNVQFTADSGELNAANLRFPLPTDSVLYKAEIYIPSQEKWVTAETMGRKEGEIIYNRVVEKKEDPLLIQKIGTDFYRARVFPINEQGDLRMRVHYAHTLKEVDDNYQLQVAFANQDSTVSTPASGVTISVQTDANYWTAGAWQLDEFGNSTTLDEFGTSSTVNLDDGIAFLNLENFAMEADIVLPLSSDEPNITSLVYQPEAAGLDEHLHVRWHPDFSDYQVMQSKQRNVVFVIDVSGSMSGAKIALTRQGIITSLKALDKNDYFGLVAFSNVAYMFRPTMSEGNDIKAAIEWVANLQSGGGTGMSEGLIAGTSIGVTSPLTDASIDLLLISDGLPNTTMSDILANIGMEADKLNRQVRIFGVGIGADLDQSLLNGLTQQTGGEATFALNDNEITGQILDLFARVRGGGLSNITVQIEGMDNSKFNWPSIFPNTVLNIAAKGTINNQIKLQGRPLNSTPIELTNTFQQLNVNKKMSQIAAPLAAKVWSDQLERQIDEMGESNELVNQAVVLARTYGIVTRYTSLLALESDELYAKQGVELIKRDPAGIALQPIAISSVDEGRIGGQGTDDDVKEEFDDIYYSPPGAITSPVIPNYVMDK
ncbi:MAG TPA: VWA domain-containing protein, partial [Thioploca sp.]|nr:VWA domain-containing protein [Thioploca sp.]